MSGGTNMKVMSLILCGISCSHHCRSPAIHLPYTQTQKVNVKGFLRYDPRWGLTWIGLLWIALFSFGCLLISSHMDLVWGPSQYLKMLPLWTFLCLEHWKIRAHQKNTFLSCRSFLTWAKEGNVSRMWVPQFIFCWVIVLKNHHIFKV